MRWSRAYEDCDDVPSKPRDGLVWWSPPVESSCEAQVEELHWTERVVTGPRSGMPYVLQHVERAGLVEPQHATVNAWDARLRVRAALRTLHAYSRGAPRPLGPSGGVAHVVPFTTQVLKAQLLLQPDGSLQLQVQWLDATPTERLQGSCAHLASSPYHYGALLARAFAEPPAAPELRARQRAAMVVA